MSSQAAKEALEVVWGVQGFSDGAAGRIKRLINGNDIASINTVLNAPAEGIVQDITESLQSLDFSPGQGLSASFFILLGTSLQRAEQLAS